MSKIYSLKVTSNKRELIYEDNILVKNKTYKNCIIPSYIIKKKERKRFNNILLDILLDLNQYTVASKANALPIQLKMLNLSPSARS